MLRVMSFNANGIRSAVQKGFWDWFIQQNVDILCVQELKAQEVDLAKMEFTGNYQGYFHCAQRKGYSGCAIWTRQEPVAVRYGFGVPEFDQEGRYVEARFDDFIVISVYFPSGSMNEDRQASKFRFLDAFYPHLQTLKQQDKEIIICGDVNIAHQNIDLKNWKGNQNSSGFLPEERQWLTKVFLDLGWVDVFRYLEPQKEQYTWWSHRGQARAKNVGWRIDYHVATLKIAQRARCASVYADEKFSDHAPLWIDYEWK